MHGAGRVNIIVIIFVTVEDSVAQVRFNSFFFLQRILVLSDVILAPCAQCVCNFVFLFVFYRNYTFYLTVLLFIVANRF